MKRFELRPSVPFEILKTVWHPITGMGMQLILTEPSLITINGHVGFRNERDIKENRHNLFIATDVTIDGKSVRAADGGEIFRVETNLDRRRHYEPLILCGNFVLPIGNYRLDVVAVMVDWEYRDATNPNGLNKGDKVTLKEPRHSFATVTVQAM